jgi:hypothetical protein
MTQVQQIDVNSIIVPEVRMTAVYDEELTKQLQASLNAVGQIQPIVVVVANSKIYLVDGLHRLQEARARGDNEIPAVVYQGDAADVLLKNLVTNRMRGKTKASEMVKVIKSLASDYGLDPDQIRDRTGFSRDYTERLLKIGGAAPEVIEALDAEVIGVGVAFEISRIPHHLAQAELVSRASIWKYTVPDIKAFVDEVLKQMDLIKNNPPKPPGAHPPRVYACDICKDTYDPKDLRFICTCPGCFSSAWQAARANKQKEGSAAAPEKPTQ